MSPGTIKAATVLQRTVLVHDMLKGIDSLPRESLDDFSRDDRDVAAAESYLRRALETLLDLGRHVLAKGFGQGALEYKQIATELGTIAGSGSHYEYIRPILYNGSGDPMRDMGWIYVPPMSNGSVVSSITEPKRTNTGNYYGQGMVKLWDITQWATIDSYKSGTLHNPLP